MNALSWLIYFADVFPNISFLATFAMVVLLITLIGTTIFKGFTSMATDKEFGTEEEATRVRQFSNMLFKINLVAVTVASFLSIVLPSKEALYMIAASEAGETVVNTPEAKEVLQDLREVLDAQLEALKAPITTK